MPEGQTPGLPPVHTEIAYELPSGQDALGQVAAYTDTHMLVTWRTGVQRSGTATGRFALGDVPDLIRTRRLRPAGGTQNTT